VARRRKGTRTAAAAELAEQAGQAGRTGQAEAPRADAGHEEGSDA
jgi:hypothetical protein